MILQTTKIDTETLRLLRIISAETGKHHYEVLRRLIREEYAKLRPERTVNNEAQ